MFHRSVTGYFSQSVLKLFNSDSKNLEVLCSVHQPADGHLFQPMRILLLNHSCLSYPRNLFKRERKASYWLVWWPVTWQKCGLPQFDPIKKVIFTITEGISSLFNLFRKQHKRKSPQHDVSRSIVHGIHALDQLGGLLNRRFLGLSCTC